MALGIEKELCCGCNACGDICPQQAIAFVPGLGGFLCPEINKSRCVECGACTNVCPMNAIKRLRKNDCIPDVWATVSRDISLRFACTSGGVFPVLANKILAEGGFVGGAVWDSEFNVKQVVSQDPQVVANMRGSKYAQSNAVGFYSAVKKALHTSKPVLVCGTPCQMTALQAFLNKDYENLIVVDFICHNVPAPAAIKKYVEYYEHKFNSKVIAIQQKNKELGWRRLTTKLTFEDGRVEYDDGCNSLFMKGFVGTGVFSRKSCQQCLYKGFPCVSDLTIGDCWGGMDGLPVEMDGDLGTSVVLCNTSKGALFFHGLVSKGEFYTKKVSLDSILKVNKALVESVAKPKFDQAAILSKLDTQNIEEALASVIPQRRVSMARKIVRLARRLWRLRRNILLTIRINGFKKVVTGKPLLIPIGNVVWDQHKTSILDVRADTLFGMPSLFSHSKMESRMLMQENTKLTLSGGHFFFGCDIQLFKGGELEIGRGFHANTDCKIACGAKIKIGSRVSFGRNVTIRDTHGHILNTPGFKMAEPISIGDHVWVSSDSAVMPGVKIASCAIVASRSFVNHDVPASTLVAGSPARVIRENVQVKM